MEKIRKIRKNGRNRHGKSVSRRVVYGVAFTLMALYTLLYCTFLCTVS